MIKNIFSHAFIFKIKGNEPLRLFASLPSTSSFIYTISQNLPVYSVFEDDRNFFEQFAKEHNFKHWEQWYDVTIFHISSVVGGRVRMRHYNNSLFRALTTIFPEHPWRPWKFRGTMKEFWNEKQNQKMFLNYLAEELGIKTHEGWYKITSDKIAEHGGSSLLNRFHFSPSAIMKEHFPDYDWKIWLFNQVPKGYWHNEKNLKEAMNWAAERLGVKNLDDWFGVSNAQMEKIGLSTLSNRFGGMSGLLTKVFPNHNWNEPKKGNFKMQNLLFMRVQELFPNASVHLRYIHPNLCHDSNKNMELDIFIPSLNLAFEYQGHQHYKKVNIYAESNSLEYRDKEKKIACEKAGISLIIVPYWWNLMKESLAATIREVRQDLIPESMIKDHKPIPVELAGHRENTIISSEKKFALVWAFFVFCITFMESTANDVTFGTAKSDNPTITNETLYWGSYRPNLYFGMKTRDLHPFQTGIMWSNIKPVPKEKSSDMRSIMYALQQNDVIRHSCEEGDKLKYGWVKHDGISFGKQEIKDGEVHLTTSFVKSSSEIGGKGGDWVARISGTSKKESIVSLMLTFGFEKDQRFNENLSLNSHSSRGISGDIIFHGHSENLGDFTILVKQDSSTQTPTLSKSEKKMKQLSDYSKTHFIGKQVSNDDVWKTKDFAQIPLRTHSDELKNLAFSLLEKSKNDENDKGVDIPLLIPTLSNEIEEESNLYILQKIVKTPFQIDIVFISHSAHPSNEDNIEEEAHSLSDSFSTKLEEHEKSFDEKFEAVFKLEKKGFNSEERKFATTAFSNLIGGIGYFHGRGIVKTKGEKNPFFTEISSLYSAVPSRSFFPRGFLWDEGFHQLIISRWNPIITEEVMRHWFHLMMPSGWIPREQILGPEARSKVPEQFQVQKETHANPPTLLFFFEKLVEKIHHEKKSVHVPEDAHVSSTSSHTKFLQNMYPFVSRFYSWMKSSQSGLSPNSFRWRGRTENHTLASGLDDYPRSESPSLNETHLDLQCWIIKSAKILKEISKEINQDSEKYQKDFETYLGVLDDLFWNEKENCYCDIQLENGTKKYLCHKGYISLFPLLMGLIPKDSDKLNATLRMIRDQRHLWTEFGLRSLSLSDPYFGTGENYWKGPIWININYLVLASLHNNYINEGPHSAFAKETYNRLRNNLISNMFKVYKETGFVWEQYNPKDGKGQRSHPFTGWSSLIVLIMAELY